MTLTRAQAKDLDWLAAKLELSATMAGQGNDLYVSVDECMFDALRSIDEAETKGYLMEAYPMLRGSHARVQWGIYVWNFFLRRVGRTPSPAEWQDAVADALKMSKEIDAT